MIKNTWIVIIVSIIVLLGLLYSGNRNTNSAEDFNIQTGGDGSCSSGSCNGALQYSAYFTPWWRTYFPGPYYGTSATAYNGYDQLLNWPYVSEYWRKPGDYYNYWSYWRRPLYLNYWRRPYYYRRPVYRPYVRDSIQGRRNRLRRFNFGPQEDLQCLENQEAQVCAQQSGSFKYGTFRNNA